MKHPFIRNILKIDALLDKQWPLFVALLLLFVLRIPNLVEPYWYGDEGIYLTIGQALNKGEVLYKEIIDHKTPIIYTLAQTHTQQNFRLLLIGWMLITTTCFYYVAKMLFKNNSIATFTATIIFVLATTLPSFEGNIPNGELFVMGFVLVGLTLLLKTPYLTRFFQPSEKKSSTASEPWIRYFLSGVFLSLGVLTKVPAVFDVALVFGIGFFTISNTVVGASKKKLSLFVTELKRSIPVWGLVVVGLLVPIVVSILFFISKGAGQAYLDFGLLYNFRYAGSWNLPFDNALLLFLFTLPGKALVMTLFTIVLVLLKKYLSPTYQLILFWFGLTLFASLLSNRPYPHYYLQVAPAFSLLLAGILFDGVGTAFKKSRKKDVLLGPLLGTISLMVFTAILLLLRVGLYPTVSYYRSFIQLSQGKLTTAEYNQRFDSLMTDNYAAVQAMEVCPDERLFIWGTNPMLYALADRVPTGRFTVSFHIKDFDAYEETYTDFVTHTPSFVVVMNNEEGEFPAFYDYLRKNYRPSTNKFDSFALWQKRDCNVE